MSNDNQLADMLQQLTGSQLRWLVARLDADTDKEAAAIVGVRPETVSRWPPIVKEALALIHQDGLLTALELRKRALARAMQVKVDGLNTRDKRLQQTVATEIIEWELGKATTPLDLTTKGEQLTALLGKVRSTLTTEDDDEDMAPA